MTMFPQALLTPDAFERGRIAGTPDTRIPSERNGAAVIRPPADTDLQKKESPAISLLLVDDEPALLDLAKAFLERTPGITVTTKESAHDALASLDQSAFDAIVSDYQMPKMDGIAFLKTVRTRTHTMPFILFTGKGREDVVIDALNSGADYYVQKGCDTRSQFAELAHKIRRAVEQRRVESALAQKNAVLQAVLAASPYGVAFTCNRTLQWVNASFARMLGYASQDLTGKKLLDLYENAGVCEQMGKRITEDLKTAGISRIITRFRHAGGFFIDAEIHIAPLLVGGRHFGHVILMADISRKVAAAGGMAPPAGLPHLELAPVIEVERTGKIRYYNEAAIDAMARYGTNGSLEEFFPDDLFEILALMDRDTVTSVTREIRIGSTAFRLNITVSAPFGIARISAVRIPGP
jgi:PAS domain S-box-containing protein